MHSDMSKGTSIAKKYRHITACLLPHVPFLLLVPGLVNGGIWLALPIVYMLGVLPVLDHVSGWQGDARFHKSDFSTSDRFLLHWNTRLYIILYIGAVLWFAKASAQLTLAELVVLLPALGIMGGVGFAATHEMLHRRQDRIDQVTQRAATIFLFYPHYKMIHVRSHHPLVATTDDKNTAWMNEGAYAYFLRTIPASVKQCWRMEAARVEKRQQGSRQRMPQNQMYVFALGQVALVAGLYLFAGVHGLLFYFAQLIGAHVVLESVNYIQHYGLMRKLDNGQLERTGAEHSWDTYHYFSSYATFRVGHHSSHHVSLKPYYLLAAEPSAQKLPVGYFWAIPIVLVPPLWRRVINPRISRPVIPATST